MALPTFNEAKKYLKDPHACFQLMTLRKHISLPPKHIGNLTDGICESLNDEMSQYCEKLEGVMIAYDNVQILQNAGIIFEELPQLHFDIKFDVIIFKPTVGSLLKGIVNKLGEQHIGCLVHNCFNASISKPVDIEMSEWKGFQLSLGDSFFFQVTDVTGQNGLIFIRGTLPEGSVPRFGKKKKKKKKHFDESTDITDDDVLSTPKEHKKRRSTALNDSLTDSAGDVSARELELSRSSSKPKKNKCSEVCGFGDSAIHSASEELADLTTEHTKETLNSHSGVVNDAELSPSVINTEVDVITKTSPDKKHKKRKKLKRELDSLMLNSEGTSDEIQKSELESAVVKLEPEIEFADETPQRHKKHKKSKLVDDSASFSEECLMDGHVMLEIKEEKMSGTPRKQKKRKRSHSDLNHSFLSGADEINNSSNFSEEAADVRLECRDDVPDIPRKKHKKKKVAEDVSLSQSQSKAFMQLNFL